MELIEKESELSLSTQAELLDISRASLYYKAVEPAAEEVAIKHRIDGHLLGCRLHRLVVQTGSAYVEQFGLY